MFILNRYLLKTTLLYFFYCCLIIVLFIFCLDLFENLAKIIKHNNSLLFFTKHYLYVIPSFYVKSSPFAVLISVIFVWRKFSFANELITIKSLGVHPYHIIKPFLYISLIAVIFNCACIHWAIPALKKNLSQHDTETNESILKNISVKYGPWCYFAKKFNKKSKELSEISIIKTDSKNTCTIRIDASQGIFKKNQLLLKNCIIYDKTQENQVIQIKKQNEKILIVPQEVLYRMEENIIISEMNTRRLFHFIHALKQNNSSFSKEQMLFHFRLSFPLSNLIILLIGIPYLLKKEYSSLQNKHIFQSLFSASCYQICSFLGLLLGYGKSLSPFIATWGIHGFFFVIGLFLLKKKLSNFG